MNRLRIILLLLLLVSLSACAPSNYVRLNYLSKNSVSQAKTDAQSVTIVQLKDSRNAKNIVGDEIGRRSDSTPFLAVSSVTNWISKGLEQELARKGIKTRYVTTPEEATGAAHTLTGEVTKVWLKQRTGTEYSAHIVVKLQLNDNPATTYESNIIRQDIPFSSITEETMTEGLRNLLESVVPSIQQQLNSME